MVNYQGQPVKETTFKGWKAFELASSQLRIVIIPELGGKIISLQHPLTEKEWLIDSGERPLIKVKFGSDFEKADMCGWDECFPTIVACPYPFKGGYEGRFLVDHGEIWSIPWDAIVEDNVLICKVKGMVLPYEFTRKIYFLNEQQVRFEYSVKNLAEEELAVFWTAHPQFAVTEQTQVCLPEETKQLLCVAGGRHLEDNRQYEWTAREGVFEKGLDHIRPISANDSRKFYVDGPVDRGWVGLYEENSGEYLTLEWSPEQVPYLGIWINEGQYNGQTACALEPCNGYYDSLTEAARQDKLLRITPQASAQWHLDVKLGTGSREEM